MSKSAHVSKFYRNGNPAAHAQSELRLASGLSGQQQILHVLNRLSYGPRPGDMARVQQIGLTNWITRQLHPETIPDEDVAPLLRGYPTLDTSTRELLQKFPNAPSPKPVEPMMGPIQTQMSQEVPVERRPMRIIQELQAARIVRAVISERQLQEVMVDFWLNHFNVYAHKDLVKWMLPAYEREAIRPHALGHFRDLLLSTARHPAMLFYLDNWLSVGATQGKTGQPSGLNENYARELMELHTLGVDGGYGEDDVREVARCFTGWSIDRPREVGQYVFHLRQHDRGEKRVLGFVIPAGGGEGDGLRVLDVLARHPSTARFIATKLARRFVQDNPSDAVVERATEVFRETDGDIRATLEAIITSPEFMSAETYRAKIKTPLEYVISAVRVLDGQVSITGTASDGAFQLSRTVANLGQPLYEAQPPTGYPDVATAWVNSSALVRRMSFALTLVPNRLPGVWVNLPQQLTGVDRRRSDEVLHRLLLVVLSDEVTPATEKILTQMLSDPKINHAMEDEHGLVNTDAETLASLVIGSPEFQRR
ncbi:MAG TPA: DUF1800 domain-containing protein [Nitrospira sp.]|nr:DUF1800 domain-containing protein [Nitrospira sp.]